MEDSESLNRPLVINAENDDQVASKEPKFKYRPVSEHIGFNHLLILKKESEVALEVKADPAAQAAKAKENAKDPEGEENLNLDAKKNEENKEKEVLNETPWIKEKELEYTPAELGC